MLSCEQSGTRDLVVLIGTCEIEHDVDLGICKKLVHRVVDLGNAVLSLRLLSALANEVTNCDELYVAKSFLEILEIDAGNATDTDHSYLHHSLFLLNL